MMQASRMASCGLLPSLLGDDGEVDHHDAVLLDQADEHDDADKGVDRQLGAEEQQGQHRPETGEGQGGEDGQRVDKTFVEDAENNIDDDDGQAKQPAHARLGILKLLGVALEGGVHAIGQDGGIKFLQIGQNIAQGDTSLGIK